MSSELRTWTEIGQERWAAVLLHSLCRHGAGPDARLLHRRQALWNHGIPEVTVAGCY